MIYHTKKPHSDWVQCARSVLYYPLLLRRVNSAADFGCNCGPWLHVLNERGITDIAGVDLYNKNDGLLFPAEKYVEHDLSKPLDLRRKFDLIIGLEVAEHLADGEIGANNYVDTLTKHGDFILFSAATPGQGGAGHINEQPHEYWHEKILTRGYAKLDIIRPLIKDDQSVLWWYKQNIFMYIKS